MKSKTLAGPRHRLATALLGSILIVAVSLTGCAATMAAASGVLTAEQAPSYAGLKPFVFVKRRFFDEERTPVLDGIEGAVRGYANLIDKVNGRRQRNTFDESRKSELRSDVALVTWPAYFTNVNYVQLVRPVAELRRYCAARSGQWKVVERNTDDPLVALRSNPVATFLDAHARVHRNLAARGAYVGFEEVRELIATDVGVEMAEEAAQANRRLESLFSTEGLRYAQRLDAFGLFSCEQSDGYHWQVSVLPATLLARNSRNDLESSMARLAIRTYDRAGAGKSGE
jgi:hypothetical protein